MLKQASAEVGAVDGIVFISVAARIHEIHTSLNEFCENLFAEKNTLFFDEK